MSYVRCEGKGNRTTFLDIILVSTIIQGSMVKKLLSSYHVMSCPTMLIALVRCLWWMTFRSRTCDPTVLL